MRLLRVMIVAGLLGDGMHDGVTGLISTVWTVEGTGRCRSTNSHSYDSIIMGRAAKPPIAISLEELQARLAAENVQDFWNVLTDEYYHGEMIPGSRRIPLDTIGRAAADLPRNREIVVYCASYDCPQSSMAARKLAALGFTNVYVFEGGIEEWLDAGNHIEFEPMRATAASIA